MALLVRQVLVVQEAQELTVMPMGALGVFKTVTGEVAEVVLAALITRALTVVLQVR